MKRSMPLLLMICCFVFACKPGKQKHGGLDMLQPLLYQQKSAEYRALCLQAYHLAKMQVDSCLRMKGRHKRFAIVSDLDETALDNSKGYAGAYLRDTVLNFADWSLHGKPGAVPGSVSFFNYAAGKGFDIYYVSNRPDSLAVVDSTRARMQVLGFPMTEVRGHFRFRELADSKEPRRRAIEAEGDTIILLLGDNLGDINKAFDKVNGKYLPGDQRRDRVDGFDGLWGTKYIVLPNAVYGDWENSFYQKYINENNGKLPGTKEKQAIREELLITDKFKQQ